MKSIRSDITTNSSNYSPFFQKGSNDFFSAKNNKSFFNALPVQAKLTVNEPGDQYEKEADSMADKVVQRLSDKSFTNGENNSKTFFTKSITHIQRKCAVCDQEEKLQKKEDDDKNPLKDKLQKKSIFESNEPPADDDKNIQRKCNTCALAGSDAGLSMVSIETRVPKLTQARRRINSLVEKEFQCPAVADSVTNIAGKGGSGTLGLTDIDKSSKLICAPKFNVDAKAGTGTFKPVQVSLVMNSKFSKPESEAPTTDKLALDGCKTDVPIFMTITSAISKLAETGENEHCDDVKRAFDQTLDPCSKEVNKYANKKFTGKTEDECFKALVAKLGFDPIDCSLEFVTLADKTGERDTNGFHDFDPVLISKDCKKIVIENKRSKTNKVGDKTVAPAIFIPASTKCAKAAPASGSTAPARVPSPTPKQVPPVQKKCAGCNEEEKLQTKAGHSSSEMVSSSVESALTFSKGSGSALPKDTRVQMENSFGADFSNVRIHDDSSSLQMNKDLNAQAFTHGSDIYFNSGKYDPDSNSGKHLLAHELTHIVQQNDGEIQRGQLPGRKARSILQKSPDDKAVAKLKVPIALDWNFTLPAVPKTPDYSIDFNVLDALEIAKLEISNPSFIPEIESTDPRKDNSSYLKKLAVDFKPVFTYLIAKELNELATTGYTQNPIKGLPLPQGEAQIVMRCFKQLLAKIQIHALQHFHRYEKVVATFQVDFMKSVESIPSSKTPYPIKKSEMEAYVTEFMLYQVALLQRKLSEDVCAWEKQDYPNLLKNTCWGGRFKDDCSLSPQPQPPAILITAGKRR